MQGQSLHHGGVVQGQGGTSFHTLHHDSMRYPVTPSTGRVPACLTSRPHQGREALPELAVPERPVLGGFPGWSSHTTARPHLSQGNIYAEVEQEYEVDSGYTEESGEVGMERTIAALYLDHQHRRPSRAIKKSQSVKTVYSSDDEWEVGARQEQRRREREGGVEREERRRPRGDRYQGQETRRRDGQCQLHDFYTVARDRV